ncbi:MAG: ACT domain-containing protein [Sphingomonadaceae bacterium]|nr:ACT domain-containing protein [Sphingomonadaceae bacterium]
MTGPVRDLASMLAGIDPRLDPQSYAFVTAVQPDVAMQLMGSAIASFREDEGLSLIVPYDAALAAGYAVDPYVRITLQVHSALDGVGLTAAVASTLAEAGIACNMVAAFHHDHAFIPAPRAQEALELLTGLQSDGAG